MLGVERTAEIDRTMQRDRLREGVSDCLGAAASADAVRALTNLLSSAFDRAVRNRARRQSGSSIELRLLA